MGVAMTLSHGTQVDNYFHKGLIHVFDNNYSRSQDQVSFPKFRFLSFACQPIRRLIDGCRHTVDRLFAPEPVEPVGPFLFDKLLRLWRGVEAGTMFFTKLRRGRLLQLQTILQKGSSENKR